MPHSAFTFDELQRYAPDVAEPADFDEFWRDTLAEAAAAPVLVDVRPEPTDLRLRRHLGRHVRRLRRRPRPRLVHPPGRRREPLPAVVEYLGYGRGRGLPHERLTWPVAGYAHLLMDNRGQGGQYGAAATPPTRTAAPRRALAGHPRHPRPARPTTTAALITDAVRAVDAVRALPGVDG